MGAETPYFFMSSTIISSSSLSSSSENGWYEIVGIPSSTATDSSRSRVSAVAVPSADLPPSSDAPGD